MQFFRKKNNKNKPKSFEWGYVIIVGIIALVVLYKCIEIIKAGFE